MCGISKVKLSRVIALLISSYSSIAFAQDIQRIVEVPYLIFQGFPSNPPFPTIQTFIPSDEFQVNLAPGETILGKSCKIELAGEILTTGVTSFPSDGGPGVVQFGIYSNTQIYNTSDGSEFPCSGEVTLYRACSEIFTKRRLYCVSQLARV